MKKNNPEGNLKKNIPLLDLRTQYLSIKNEIDAAISKVVDAQNFIMGEDIKVLENSIAAYCSGKFAVGVSSGTDALLLSLKAVGLKEGDEVITVPFTFIATAGAIYNAGGKPVFCDIDPKTYNMDPKKLAEKITKKTKVIMPVHLYGQCAEMDEIMKIAKSHNLKVIEDTAQAIGATYKNHKAASIGDIGCISFFPSKNLGAYGDGGMIVTNSEEFAEKISVLRVHGSKKRYIHSIIGTNSRLDNLQAAILNVKLKYLDKWAKMRQDNARLYNILLKDLCVTTPYVAPHNTHVYHQYVIKVDPSKRDLLVNHLVNNNVESRVYYPICLHLQECFKFLGYKMGDFPESEQASLSTLALPVYPELKEEEIAYISGLIKGFLQ